MTDETMLDILRQIGARAAAAAHIVKTSEEQDDIRCVLPTLIEDNHEAFQTLLEAVAISPEPTDL